MNTDQVKVFDAITAHPDGSISVQLGPETIELPSLIDYRLDQKGHQPVEKRPVGAEEVGREGCIHAGFRRLFKQFRGAGDGRDRLGQLDADCLLCGAGLAVLLVALLLSHAAQHIRRDSETEGAAAR